MKLTVSAKHLKSAMMCKAKNDVRWYLTGVLFHSDGSLIGTNGHVMFVGEHSSKIDKDVIIGFNCNLPAKFSYAEIDIIDGCEDGIVKFYDSLVASKVIASGMVVVIDGKFPDYKRIAKAERKATDHIGFNGGYLSLVGKISSLFSRYSTVDLGLNGENGCAFCDMYDPEGSKAAIYVMPVRL